MPGEDGKFLPLRPLRLKLKCLYVRVCLDINQNQYQRTIVVVFISLLILRKA